MLFVLPFPLSAKACTADALTRLARLSTNKQNLTAIETGAYAAQTLLGNVLGYSAYLLASITVELAVKVIAPRYSGICNQAVLATSRKGAGYLGYALGSLITASLTPVVKVLDNLSGLYNGIRNGIDTFIAKSHILRTQDNANAPAISYQVDREAFCESFNAKLNQYQDQSPRDSFVSLFRASPTNNAQAVENSSGIFTRVGAWFGGFFSTQPEAEVQTAMASPANGVNDNLPVVNAVPVV